MRRVYADAVVFTSDALEACIRVCGTDNVLYGSAYPHTIGDMAGCDLDRRFVRGARAFPVVGRDRLPCWAVVPAGNPGDSAAMSATPASVVAPERGWLPVTREAAKTRTA